MPCLLPEITFVVWAVLVCFGLDPIASLVPFLVAELFAWRVQSMWRRKGRL